jgi:hypothetical protein
MEINNYREKILSFCLVSKIHYLVFAGCVSWLIPGTLLAGQQQPPVLATATAGSVIVKTAFSDTGVLADTRSSVASSLDDRSVTADGQSLPLRAALTDAAGTAQAYNVYAAIAAAEYGVPVPGHVRLSNSESNAEQGTTGPAANGELIEAPKQDESSQRSYALVLALIALIGLVPVSRRNQ